MNLSGKSTAVGRLSGECAVWPPTGKLRLGDWATDEGNSQVKGQRRYRMFFRCLFLFFAWLQHLDKGGKTLAKAYAPI